MTSRDDHHRVYVSFQFRNGWHCQFLEADLKTSLPKRLHFASPDKVIELVQRGGGIADQEGQADAESGNRDGKRRSIPQSDARAVLKAEALSSRSICMTVPSSGSNPVCSLLSRVCRPFWATIHVYSPIQHSYLARSRTDHPDDGFTRLLDPVQDLLVLNLRFGVAVNCCAYLLPEGVVFTRVRRHVGQDGQLVHVRIVFRINSLELGMDRFVAGAGQTGKALVDLYIRIAEMEVGVVVITRQPAGCFVGDGVGLGLEAFPLDEATEGFGVSKVFLTGEIRPDSDHSFGSG